MLPPLPAGGDKDLVTVMVMDHPFTPPQRERTEEDQRFKGNCDRGVCFLSTLLVEGKKGCRMLAAF